MLSCKYVSPYVFSFVMFNCSLSLYISSSHSAHCYSITGKLYTALFDQSVRKLMFMQLIKCTLYRYTYACMHYIALINVISSIITIKCLYILTITYVIYIFTSLGYITGARNAYIDDVAFSRDTSLTHLLQNNGRHDDNHEDHDIAIVKHSSYYTTDDFTNTRLATGSLNILSLNCQSLNAKFNKLQIFIEEMCHYQFGVICLQESWLDVNFE